MLEPKEKVITVTSKQKYDGTSSAVCPFVCVIMLLIHVYTL